MAAAILALWYLFQLVLVTGLAHWMCPEDKMGHGGGLKAVLSGIVLRSLWCYGSWARSWRLEFGKESSILGRGLEGRKEWGRGGQGVIRGSERPVWPEGEAVAWSLCGRGGLELAGWNDISVMLTHMGTNKTQWREGKVGSTFLWPRGLGCLLSAGSLTKLWVLGADLRVWIIYGSWSSRCAVGIRNEIFFFSWRRLQR